MDDLERAEWAKRWSNIFFGIVVGLIALTALIFLLGRHGFN